MECAGRTFFRQEDPMVMLAASLVPLAPTLLVLVVLSAAPAAAERADKPTLRSTMPSHVDAAQDRSDAPARVRVVEKPAVRPAKVNINTADVKSLMTLTGVGRKVAEKIVEYRDSHGPFKQADEIRKVEGVGHGVWTK
jgi:competence ComEA-like helix-hairpin-helix protein